MCHTYSESWRCTVSHSASHVSVFIENTGFLETAPEVTELTSQCKTEVGCFELFDWIVLHDFTLFGVYKCIISTIFHQLPLQNMGFGEPGSDLILAMCLSSFIHDTFLCDKVYRFCFSVSMNLWKRCENRDKNALKCIKMHKNAKKNAWKCTKMHIA